MYHFSTIRTILTVLLLLLQFRANTQARLVLNGGVVVIRNNATLTIDNTNPNAITRTAGYISSEGENNNIRWNVSLANADLTIPFGNTTAYFPLSFTKDAAVGTGSFTFATYPTGWQNSLSLPAPVTEFTDAAGQDNSKFVIDRFWKIKAEYAEKPDLKNVKFTYIDNEHAQTQNTIPEITLQAQRWNGEQQIWGDYPPTGTIDPVLNTVNISTLAGADLYDWWTLVSHNAMLPITVSDFTVNCSNDYHLLEWNCNTADVGDKLELQVSTNGNFWNTLQSYQPTSTNKKMQYVHRALPEEKYFRLKITDLNGQEQISEILHAPCAYGQELHIYPNPSQGGTINITGIFADTIELFNEFGKHIQSISLNQPGEKVVLTQLEAGIYFLKSSRGGTQKVVILN